MARWLFLGLLDLYISHSAEATLYASAVAVFSVL